MPFIVNPNYIPQDPEWERHYKPEQQGCADCNGVRVPPPGKTFSREILTCDGVKTIETTKPPNTPPVINREMDKQFLAAVPTLKRSLVVGKSTRQLSDVTVTTVDVLDLYRSL